MNHNAVLDSVFEERFAQSPARKAPSPDAPTKLNKMQHAAIPELPHDAFHSVRSPADMSSPKSTPSYNREKFSGENSTENVQTHIRRVHEFCSLHGLHTRLNDIQLALFVKDTLRGSALSAADLFVWANANDLVVYLCKEFKREDAILAARIELDALPKLNSANYDIVLTKQRELVRQGFVDAVGELRALHASVPAEYLPSIVSMDVSAARQHIRLLFQLTKPTPATRSATHVHAVAPVTAHAPQLAPAPAPAPAPSPELLAMVMAFQSMLSAHAPAKPKPRVPNSSGHPCRIFLREGKCKYGASCIHKHAA
jgi:hypothetical protein